MLQVLKAITTSLRKKRPPAVERRSPGKASRSPPQLNTSIVNGTLLMEITSPLNDELWKWLATNGWRVLAYPNNRRSYKQLPYETFTRLEASPPAERAMFVRALFRRWGDK